MESIALKIINHYGLRKLEKEIEQLKDSSEREVRERLLDAIWDKTYEYDAHILDYEYKQHIMELSERGLKFVPVKKSPVVANWDEVFTSTVSEQAKSHAKNFLLGAAFP